MIGGRSCLNRKKKQPQSCMPSSSKSPVRRILWRPVPPCHNVPGKGSTNMEYGAAALVTGVAWLLYYVTLQAGFAYDDSIYSETDHTQRQQLVLRKECRLYGKAFTYFAAGK
ncbi:hypothetical protein TNIN_48191 [Trichonephila inaurata madagascariensis]|uniref:Uncharacterized protein n=1 Tax=Trichonephila inaurata madagascariensis TaxID=2747483 RepID=A0A8X6YH49_9ARAC|nr:hypothetical protein TNIN_48191 [Trichonephila inaurata madagascariensis]